MSRLPAGFIRWRALLPALCVLLLATVAAALLSRSRLHAVDGCLDPDLAALGLLDPTGSERPAIDLPRAVPDLPTQPLSFERDSGRVVLLGLDGADWRVLDPLIKAGVLPNLARLLAGGAAGVLQTDCAYSPVSWTTIATGRPAEQHGISPDIDVEQAWGGMDIEPQDLKVRRIWEMARDAGRTIAVYDYYFCAKRQAGDWGYIPGLDPLEPSTLPAGLELGRCPPPDKGRDPDLLGLKACILGQVPIDLTVILATESDAAGHRAMLGWLRRWHPELFELDPRVPRLNEDDGVTRAWIEIDRGLGELWAELPAGSHLVICSDHGFALPHADRLTSSFSDELLAALDLDRAALDRDNFPKIDGRYGALSVQRTWRIERVAVAHYKGQEQPEWVYLVLEQLLLGGGRNAHAVWTAQAIRDLNALLGERSRQVELRAESDRTLLITPRSDALVRLLSRGGLSSDRWAMDVVFQTGEHYPADQGVVLIVGPKVRPGSRIEGARLQDVAPTLLYLLGLPVGRDLPGRVLIEAFEERALRAAPVQYVDTYETTPIRRDALRIQDLPSSPEQLDPEVRRRLRSLGYLK